MRSLLPAPPSTVVKALLTKKCWPSLDSRWKISSAWAALRLIPTRRAAERGQERYLERAGQGATPRDQPTALRILRTLARYLETGEGDVKRLQNIEPPEFRLRVGDYRVPFHDRGDTIRITAIKHAAKPTADARLPFFPFHSGTQTGAERKPGQARTLLMRRASGRSEEFAKRTQLDSHRPRCHRHRALKTRGRHGHAFVFEYSANSPTQLPWDAWVV